MTAGSVMGISAHSFFFRWGELDDISAAVPGTACRAHGVRDFCVQIKKAFFKSHFLHHDIDISVVVRGFFSFHHAEGDHLTADGAVVVVVFDDMLVDFVLCVGFSGFQRF